MVNGRAGGDLHDSETALARSAILHLVRTLAGGYRVDSGALVEALEQVLDQAREWHLGRGKLEP